MVVGVSTVTPTTTGQVEIDDDGPQDWRPDLQATVRRWGVDWGAATADLDRPDVLNA